jgi:hypothetical protein
VLALVAESIFGGVRKIAVKNMLLCIGKNIYFPIECDHYHISCWSHFGSMLGCSKSEEAMAGGGECFLRHLAVMVLS